MENLRVESSAALRGSFRDKDAALEAARAIARRSGQPVFVMQGMKMLARIVPPSPAAQQMGAGPSPYLLRQVAEELKERVRDRERVRLARERRLREGGPLR